jgi:hypothetical protein
VNPDPRGLARRLDALARPAPEPEDAALTDEVRVVRWAGPMFALCSVILVPWTVYLGVTLPSRQVSPNYDVAWAGFDVILALALASTGYFALRRSRYLAVVAAATATLLVIDAWFDCITSPEGQLWQAILMAALIEIPLAAVCAWLSYHTEHLTEERILLQHRDRSR